MGLNITHGAWDGGYGTFYSWRTRICELMGYPPLNLMDGFCNNDPTKNPIKWNILKPNPLKNLLYHSDCDGSISWKMCGKIADELEKLIPLCEEEKDDWIKNKIEIFIEGARLAHSLKENLEFH